MVGVRTPERLRNAYSAVMCEQHLSTVEIQISRTLSQFSVWVCEHYIAGQVVMKDKKKKVARERLRIEQLMGSRRPLQIPSARPKR